MRHPPASVVTPALAMLLLAATGCPSRPSGRAPGPGAETSVLHIEGMTCEGCVKAIEGTIAKEKGVHSGAVSLEAKEARIVADPTQVDLPGLLQRIAKLGYQAQLAPATNAPPGS